MVSVHDEIIEMLKKNAGLLPRINILLGFDGFIDSIVRAVKSKVEDGSCEFFEFISEFGSYIVSKGGKSCGIELIDQVKKFGGNMPIMAAAFVELGFKTSCIGALGDGQIRPEFSVLLRDNCHIFSIADPGYSTAIEFNDGKVMLGDMTSLGKLNWDSVKEAVGIDKILDLFNKSRLICMLNWSETDGSTSIWRGILEEVVPKLNGKKERIMFFDLSDCSKKSAADIKNVLKLVSEYKNHFKVILGMNENEASVIYSCMARNDIASLEEVGNCIYDFVDVDVLVIHPRDCALAWTDSGVTKADGYYIDTPKISTGGGDNFNAGFCTAQLMGMSIEQSLVLANAVSSFYVKNGFSPNLEQLADYLLECKSRKE